MRVFRLSIGMSVLVGSSVPALAEPTDAGELSDLVAAIDAAAGTSLTLEDPRVLLPSPPVAVPALGDLVIRYDGGTSAVNALLRIGVPGVEYDDGDPAVDPLVPAQQLLPVVRLLAGNTPDGPLLCTATLVTWDGEVGILTAAHCLYEQGEQEDQIGKALATAVYVEGLGAVAPSTARFEPSFSACPGLFYEQCMALGGVDLAFLPMAAPSTWSVCTSPIAESELVGFGYGLDRDRLPRELLKGSLRATPAASGLWSSRSDRGQQVNFGDSGGPVITANDDLLLSLLPPKVCFVAAARRGDESLLQPVWMYGASLLGPPIP
jgi:hypothetical protein